MRRNTVCVIHSYSTVPGIQEIFYGCLLVLRMNRWLMNWSLLQLGVLEESNAASLNYWHFAKVPKQADYSPSTWSCPGVLSWQNCSRGPKWVGFDRDSESHGGSTAVGARRHIRVHSGFWEDESPFSSCQKYISPMSSSSSFSSMSFSSSFYTKGRSGEWEIMSFLKLLMNITLKTTTTTKPN